MWNLQIALALLKPLDNDILSVKLQLCVPGLGFCHREISLHFEILTTLHMGETSHWSVMMKCQNRPGCMSIMAYSYIPHNGTTTRFPSSMEDSAFGSEGSRNYLCMRIDTADCICACPFPVSLWCHILLRWVRALYCQQTKPCCFPDIVVIHWWLSSIGLHLCYRKVPIWYKWILCCWYHHTFLDSHQQN